MIGSFASPFTHQPYPFLQSLQQIPQGYPGVPFPFAPQNQSYTVTLQQVLQTIATQVNHLNQQNQQQSQILQQLAQIVPQQLQHIQQFLQQLTQPSGIQQPIGSGAGPFSPFQSQPFGGSGPWPIPQHSVAGGPGAVASSFGFPHLGSQPGSVM